MSTDVAQSEQIDRLTLEIENLRRQNEKLEIEIQSLRVLSPTNVWEGYAARFLPIVSAFVAVGGLWFGVMQYMRAEAESLDQQKENNKTVVLELKRETAKPLWGKQLDLYIEAAELAATIATTKDADERAKAESRFWILYWGPLAAVEDVGLTKSTSAEIEAAMVRFGNELTTTPNKRDKGKLREQSLSLAHAIREALAPAFDVETTELENLRKPFSN